VVAPASCSLRQHKGKGWGGGVGIKGACNVLALFPKRQ